jgi:hypothetical protein
VIVELCSQLFISHIIVLPTGLFGVSASQSTDIVVNKGDCLKVLGIKVFEARHIFTLDIDIIVLLFLTRRLR